MPTRNNADTQIFVTMAPQTRYLSLASSIVLVVGLVYPSVGSLVEPWSSSLIQDDGMPLASSLEEQKHRSVHQIIASDMQHDADSVRVIVGYWGKDDDEYGSSMTSRIRSVTSSSSYVKLPFVSAVAVSANKTALLTLRDDPFVRFIERDAIMTASMDFVPYGVRLMYRKLPNKVRQPPSSMACETPSTFRIAVIDSGVYSGHLDLPCGGYDSKGCIGRSFGVSSPWYSDLNGHGKCESYCLTFWLLLSTLDLTALILQRHACPWNDWSTCK